MSERERGFDYGGTEGISDDINVKAIEGKLLFVFAKSLIKILLFDKIFSKYS